MKFCPQCGSEYDSQVEYCSKDGAALSLSPLRADRLEGRVIDRKYRILEKLGGGGMGVVYKAEHIFLNKIVAVKILHSHLSADQEYLQRFQREARTACQIRHRSAILLHDFGVDGDLPYLAMDYIEGQTLAEVLKDEKTLSPERVYDIVSQISGALGEAHALGVIHRDLKPENIMLSVAKDGREVAQVLDFGIAKVLHTENEGDTPLTKFGTVFGSPKYMAPEQALQGELDQRTDLYALGVMIYEMLSGTVPFDISSPLAIMVKHAHDAPKPLKDAAPEKKFTEAINAVVMKLLEKEKANRYPSVKEFLIDFESAFVPERLQHASTAAGPSWQAFAGVVLLALVAMSGGYYYLRPVAGGEDARQLRRELERLEVEKLTKQREAEAAAKAAAESQQEVERAQQELERQRLVAEQVQRETEALKSAWLEEETRIEKLKSEADEATKAALVQRELAEKASAEVETQRQARLAEEQRVIAIQDEAAKAALLVKQRQEEAAQVKEELESHREERLKEEETALKLKADAEAAAATAKEFEAKIRAAEEQKQKLEESARAAEERRAKVELEIKEAQKQSIAKKDKSPKEPAVVSSGSLTEDEKRKAALRELEVAERKREAAMRAAAEAERKRVAAEQAARNAKILAEKRAMQADAASSSAVSASSIDDSAESDSERKHLPRQGKKRF